MLVFCPVVNPTCKCLLNKSSQQCRVRHHMSTVVFASSNQLSGKTSSTVKPNLAVISDKQFAFVYSFPRANGCSLKLIKYYHWYQLVRTESDSSTVISFYYYDFVDKFFVIANSPVSLCKFVKDSHTALLYCNVVRSRGWFMRPYLFGLTGPNKNYLTSLELKKWLEMEGVEWKSAKLEPIYPQTKGR